MATPAAQRSTPLLRRSRPHADKQPSLRDGDGDSSDDWAWDSDGIDEEERREERAKAEAAFDKLDRRGNGWVQESEFEALMEEVGTTYSIEDHKPTLLSICKGSRLHRAAFVSWYEEWLFAEEDSSSADEWQTNSVNIALQLEHAWYDISENLVGNRTFEWKCGACLVFNPQTSMRCLSCRATNYTQVGNETSVGRMSGGSSGGSSGGLTVESPAGSDTIWGADLSAMAAGGARPLSPTAEIASSPGRHILGGGSGGLTGDSTLRQPDVRAAAAPDVPLPESPTAQTASSSGGRILGGASGGTSGGLTIGSPAGSDTIGQPDLRTAAGSGALPLSPAAEIARSPSHRILGGGRGGLTGDSTLREPYVRAAAAADVSLPESPSAQTASSSSGRMSGGASWVWTQDATGVSTSRAQDAINISTRTETAPVPSTVDTDTCWDRQVRLYGNPPSQSTEMALPASPTSRLATGSGGGNSGGDNGGARVGLSDRIDEKERREERAKAGAAFDGLDRRGNGRVKKTQFSALMKALGTTYFVEGHKPKLLAICRKGRLHREAFLSWYEEWLFAGDDWSDREEEGQANSAHAAVGHERYVTDFESLIGLQAASWKCRACLVFNPRRYHFCLCCRTVTTLEQMEVAAAARPFGGGVRKGGRGYPTGGLAFLQVDAFDDDALRAPDQPTVASEVTLHEPPTAETAEEGRVAAASSSGGGILGGATGGTSGGFTFTVPRDSATAVAVAGVVALGPSTSETVNHGEEAGAGAAVQVPAADVEAEQRRRNDDLFALVQGGVLAECTPEQKAALSTMMNHHVDQVGGLRAEKRELNDTIERQADLLSATLQAFEDERRADYTRFDDESRRLEALVEETERKLEAERELMIVRSAHVQATLDDMRASVGQLASLPQRKLGALGSVSSLDTVLEECVICSELLLSGIGKASFGIMSYSCGCSHVRTLHVNCIVSMSSLNCPLCNEKIVVIAPSLMAQTRTCSITVRKN